MHHTSGYLTCKIWQNKVNAGTQVKASHSKRQCCKNKPQNLKETFLEKLILFN